MLRVQAAIAAGLVLLRTPVLAAGVASLEAVARARAAGRVAVVVALRPPAAPPGSRSPADRRAQVALLRDAVLRTVRSDDVAVQRAYAVAAGFAATVSAAGLAALARNPDVVRIDVGREGGGGLMRSVPHIRADRVQARGITGAGTVIAVLDTGVDRNHPDLHDALIHEECFCSPGCCPDGSSRQSGPGSATSRHAHGVHVAGIALSRGRVAPVGVAPGASLLAVRVLNDSNRGLLTDWIAGLDWVAAARPDVRIVNMSLVSDALFPGLCDTDGAENLLFAQLIDFLHGRGTLVFAAAGNNRRPDALAAPACVERAVAVGAVTPDDQVAPFSNSSPALDLLAPGVGPGTVGILSDAPGGGVVTIAGTSMATAHASGAAALLLSARPAVTGAQLEAALTATGRPIFDGRNGLVVPRVNAFAALRAASEGAELQRGGGSRRTDCLLEWNIIPPASSRTPARPVAVCTDNDSACDADGVAGQCTFVLSLCFNVPDPSLPDCPATEPLTAYTIASPRPGAAPGSVELLNARHLERAMPAFPLVGSSVCTIPFPFVVPRGAAPRAVGTLRIAVRTATRGDADRVRLICAAP